MDAPDLLYPIWTSNLSILLLMWYTASFFLFRHCKEATPIPKTECKWTQWIWRQDGPANFQAPPLILESESTGILSRGIYKPPWIVPVCGIRWRAGIYHLELLNPGQPSYAKQDSMGGILQFKHFLAARQIVSPGLWHRRTGQSRIAQIGPRLG